jgi:hypothetical protein
MLPEGTTNQLLAARHLYYLAEQNIRSEQTASLFAGVNLLQDSVEAFLWAAATYRQSGARDRIEIHQLFDAVCSAIDPQVLPFRPAITQLNRLRINSKHYGICPDHKEAQRLLLDVREFLRESTYIVLNVDFWTVSLIDLIPNSGDLNSVAYWLRRAESAFLAESFRDCLIYCRHAIYLEFEALYDISPYANPDYKPGIGTFISSAPSWALTRHYIQNHVNNPCQFIVLNYDDLHRKLWEYGIDATTFWNLRRLTPDVFLPREKK